LTSAPKDRGEKERKIIERIPAERWGSSEDLAGAVTNLYARNKNNIGGEVHAVDGGYLGR